MKTFVRIRPETTVDIPAVQNLLRQAFPTDAEACLVKALRHAAEPRVSLVACDATGAVVGHVFHSPVSLTNPITAPLPLTFGLAPLAVLPEKQKQGIGAALIRESMAACWVLGAGAVVVLGDPKYYGRFGFRGAERYRLSCEYTAPPGYFQVNELIPGSLMACTGVVRYHDAFAAI